MKQFILSSSEATQRLAANLTQVVTQETVIFLKGALGSGKTTFTQGLGRALGIQRAIKSPTYTIVKEYTIPNTQRMLVHIDAYRLEGQDAEILDLANYLKSDNIIVIEWPEYIDESIFSSYLVLQFDVVEENIRSITATIKGKEQPYYTQFLNKWDERQ